MSRKLDLRHEPLLSIPGEATIAVTGVSDAQLLPGGLFVKWDTDNFKFVLAGVGDELAGVLNCTVAAGAIANIAVLGPTFITLGDVVADGAYVECNAASKAVTATGTRPIAGKILTGGVAGEVVTLLYGFRPQTPASAAAAQVTSANGAQITESVIEEEITLSTIGATTDSTANLLPANSEILGVVARVTAGITVATNWALGDATTAARFLAATTDLTATTTKIGLAHRQGGISTDATGPVQIAAAKLRITTTGTPGAGKVRVAVFYRQLVAPTA